jgi:DHA2 family multidrug resistance protein
MVDNYSWQYIFLTKFPIGLVAAFLVWRYLEDSPYRNLSKAIDWTGIGLLSVGLGSLQYVLEEGQRYDWFDDASITRCSATAAICLATFIVWELRRANAAPVVELRVLKDRGLSAGVLLTTLVGFAIYGTTYIFPVFVQNILRFTPTESGVSLVPSGVFMGIAVLAGGRLMQRGIDARHLILFGIPITILAMWFLGNLTPLSGFDDAQTGLILRGIGLGFISTPITVAAFAGLKERDYAAGAALLNLCRQLGGSFGIAILSSYVQSMATFHRTMLVSNLATTNQLLNVRVAATSTDLITKGMNPTAAHEAALALVDRAVQRQAMTMAYNNAYLLVAFVFVALIPSVFLFKHKPPCVNAKHSID